ncbi:hypothetical protein ETB97_008501 [Aspergillus alliaceus]|uniref:Zn(2)-C6 fungal-type domain-containing protein n=1 Tax=Petromyces alliaceus TaxID=209559 RepID=A0A8H6AD48_PETAA|nr:hypothetical protein ETB97_008501 [Aspergillus burnettii]
MSDDTTTATKGRRQNKGLACEECRSRKLRCDMNQPQCGTCNNLGVPCVTNTARRPRGPRKGHVKILRSRIASLERLLQESSEGQTGYGPGYVEPTLKVFDADHSVKVNIAEEPIKQDNTVQVRGSSEECAAYHMEAQSMELPKWPSMAPLLDVDSEWAKPIGSLPDSTYFSSEPTPPSNISNPLSSTWPLEADMSPLDLGAQALTPKFLASQLPLQLSPLELADLDDLFFERAYPFAPIINQQRYYARAAKELDSSEPFTCLQYAIRTLAASMGSQFKGILPLLYTHTCCTLDAWEQNVPNEALPIELAQARLLLAIYEILKINPKKGWISAGRCFHLVHLVKLDQIDNPNAWQSPALSWVEIEERRRTFWTAYALDRYGNLVNGLPLTLNDEMILTRLPAPEAAFQCQRSVNTDFLAPAIAKKSEKQLSPYAKSIVILSVFARCLCHRNQCHVERIIEPTSQEFLVRHRVLDSILSHEVQTNLSTDQDPYDPTLLFIDMLTQAAVLILFTALNSVPEPTNTYQDIYNVYEKKASKAVETMRYQAQKLAQLGCFKVHPFTSIALFICAEFARSCKGLNQNTTTDFNALSAALSNLAPANSLARMLELELQGTPEVASVIRGL